MKKFFSVAFCCFVLVIQLSGCGSVNSVMHGTPPSFQSQVKLIAASDFIFYGEVIKEYKAEKINISAEKSKEAKINEDNRVLYTVFDFRVDEAIKGNIKSGDIIKVKQLGDKIKAQVSEIVDAGGYFKTGGKYVLFLASFEDILPGTPYETLSPTVGHLEIIDDMVNVSKYNKLFVNNESKDDMLKYLKMKVADLNN